MTQQILLAITFVYGPLYLITLLKIFNKHLESIIKDIKEYGKPVQTNKTSAYSELQIITPIWNNLKY